MRNRFEKVLIIYAFDQCNSSIGSANGMCGAGLSICLANRVQQ